MKLQLVAKNLKKLKGGPFGDMKKFPKNVFNEIFEQCHSAEKCKRGDPLRFFDIHCVAKHQKKLKGGPFGEKISIQKVSKSRIVPKKVGILSVISRLWTSVLFFLFVLDASEVGVVEVWSCGGCWTNEQKVDLSCLKKTTHCNSRAHFLLKCAD